MYVNICDSDSNVSFLSSFSRSCAALSHLCVCVYVCMYVRSVTVYVTSDSKNELLEHVLTVLRGVFTLMYVFMYVRKYM